MRKIKRNEIDKTCKAFAEMFEDYPLYFALFGKDEKTFERNFYLFKTEVLLAKNYTYANDDFTVICSVKRPSDKEGDMRRIFANPFFAIPFFKAVGKEQAKIALEYAKPRTKLQKDTTIRQPIAISKRGSCKVASRTGTAAQDDRRALQRYADMS